MGWLKGTIAVIAIAIGGTAAAGWVYYRPVLAPFQLQANSSGTEASQERRLLYACNPDRAGLILLPGALPEAKAAIAREITDPQQQQLASQLLENLERETKLGVGTSIGPVWLKQQESTISRVVGETVRQQLTTELQKESDPLAAALGNQFTDALLQPLVNQVTTQVIGVANVVLEQNINRACGTTAAFGSAPAAK
ncbi:hypothetical protein [Synechococcus elongatus]|uniref:hypothetical protein n=1 Tax=Synechococcus elongatus TaxID=32046 RepID=UPI000F7D6CAA|nr:hypothetical protein [Synechococcus elongatus]